MHKGRHDSERYRGGLVFNWRDDLALRLARFPALRATATAMAARIGAARFARLRFGRRIFLAVALLRAILTVFWATPALLGGSIATFATALGWSLAGAPASLPPAPTLALAIVPHGRAHRRIVAPARTEIGA